MPTLRHRYFEPFQTLVTCISHGMPVSGELDYADSVTLISTIEFRREMKVLKYRNYAKPALLIRFRRGFRNFATTRQVSQQAGI